MALHNFPVQWTADNVADRDPQRLSPCRCPSYFTTLTYIMKRSVSHAGPCTVPVPAAHVLFVYVDAVKGLPDPQHGRELVVCRCRFRRYHCRQLRMLHVCADPVHSLRSCISFLLLQLSCLLSFWKATKGWRQQPGGRMRCAGHNNNLCPVTSCHISCMINELISAHSAHNIPRLFCRKTGAHPLISTMENRLDKDCQRDSREGDRERGVVNWQLDWGTNQHTTIDDCRSCWRCERERERERETRITRWAY